MGPGTAQGRESKLCLLVPIVAVGGHHDWR
jgi:hypothetical protein